MLAIDGERQGGGGHIDRVHYKAKRRARASLPE
jgi:hypothetical protein